MILTLKILITLTLLFYFAVSWGKAISVATVGIAAEHSLTVGPVARKKVKDASGRATLKSLGATFWLVPLTVLVWVFL